MTVVIIVVALLGTVMCGPLPSRDVLAGQEFLAVYMRSHQPGNKRSSYFINNNLVNERTTLPTTFETTTIVDTTEMPPSQIVKVVGVSSSVVRQSGKPQEKSLVTIEEPTITAVQRSHFGVDESSGTLTINQGTPDSGFSIETRQDSESSRISVKQNHNSDSSSSFSIHRNIQPNLDKVEERTSFSVGIKQETKTESLPTETFNTERPRRNWVRPDNLYRKHKEITQKDNSDTTNQPHAERLFAEPIQETIRKERISYTVATEGARLDNWSTDENVYDADIRKEKPKNYHYQGKKDYRERDSRQYVPEQKNWEYSEKVYGEPEKNYEVDEAASVMSNGRVNGVQDSATQNPNKFGYVVEGSDFRKYRVEEKTSDGFIVGEYGVVSHNDGSLRGVRYTADSNINPRLIYDTLVKFLSLK